MAAAKSPNRVETSQPLNTPAAVEPPDAVTAAYASVGVTEFTMKIEPTITHGAVPSLTCSTATVSPTVK